MKAKITEIIRSQAVRQEIPRFLVAGISAVSCDFLVYYSLIPFFSYAPAKTISFLSGAIASYFINKNWTFSQKDLSHGRALPFLLLNFFTLAANVGANQLALWLLGEQIIISFIFATGLSTVLNFVGQKYWVFRKAL